MARFTISQLLRDQWCKLPQVETFKGNITGRTIIITGANVGLGLECARHLARMQPGKLILACRDTAKGTVAVEAIVKDTGCAHVEYWMLDLAKFDSVQAFAERFDKEGGGKLDILIENAGVSTFTYRKTHDGWEETIQVNHLATCLLAFRLLPFLLKSGSSSSVARLVVVSSDGHYVPADIKEAEAPNMLKKLSDEEYCQSLVIRAQRYPITKLFNVLFTRALASRVPVGSALTVNCVNPGTAQSALQRDIFILRIYTAFIARTTEVASRTLVHAAVSPDLEGVTGQYFNVCEVNEPSDLVVSERGKVLEQRLWNETLEVLSAVDPKVPQIIREYLTQ